MAEAFFAVDLFVVVVVERGGERGVRKMRAREGKSELRPNGCAKPNDTWLEAQYMQPHFYSYAARHTYIQQTPSNFIRCLTIRRMMM